MYIQSLPAIRSELAVPLIAKKRVIGVVDLESPWPDFFTEQHQNLLELLAGRIAAAIENAALFRRSVRQSKTLQLLNEISRDLSSVLVLNELLRKIGTLTKHLIDYHRFSILLAEERTQAFNTVINQPRFVLPPRFGPRAAVAGSGKQQAPRASPVAPGRLFLRTLAQLQHWRARWPPLC